MRFLLFFSLFLFSLGCQKTVNYGGLRAYSLDGNQFQLNVRHTIAVEPIAEMPEWFLGWWLFRGKESVTEEVWEQDNDSTYSATSYLTVKAGTVVSEYITLELRNGHLFYKPTPQLSNAENVTTTFQLTVSGRDCVVFENPLHDFPRKIIYQKSGDDSLYATLTGVTLEGPDTVIFGMKKKR